MTDPRKITFGEMREMGVRSILIYCRNRCGHRTEANADGWADDVRLSDIEPNFVCTLCGRRGAEIRPSSGLEQLRQSWAYYAVTPGEADSNVKPKFEILPST